jgi:hypothetical protein
VVVLLAVAAPGAAAAGPLLQGELSLGDAGPLLALAQKPSAEKPAGKAPAAAPPKAPSLDFDLLGTPAAAPRIDDALLKRRRSMLDLHQKVGLGLVALQLAATVAGQLNYLDKYGGTSPPVTGRYELTHTVLAYSTLGVFAVNGALALLAPGSQVKKKSWDRTTVHKLGMAVATVGMLAQGVLGVYADRREGYLDQERIATTHLLIGYVTFVAVGVAVGALVF